MLLLATSVYQWEDAEEGDQIGKAEFDIEAAPGEPS
jgi:hypothetical protein